MVDLPVGGELARDVIRQQVDVGTGIGQSFYLGRLTLAVCEDAGNPVEGSVAQVDDISGSEVDLHVAQIHVEADEVDATAARVPAGLDAVGLQCCCLGLRLGGAFGSVGG